jgi:ribosomal peptide maturation radical SAM protein 1
VQVILAQLPFGSLSRPSLGLGILKASLRPRGISCRVVHANVSFAERLGLPLYNLIEANAKSTLLGEWVFAPAAHPEHRPDDSGLLERAGRAIPSVVVEAAGEGATLGELLARARWAAAEEIEALAQELCAARPRVVGCTTMFQQHNASLALLRAIKRLDPTIHTVLGGANCAGAMGRATHRNFTWVDYVVSGEADHAFAELCAALLDGPGPSPALPAGVLGPAHRNDGLAAERVTPLVVDHLDSIPEPDFDDYFARLQASPLRPFIHPTLPLETSRGCWWGEVRHCTFCGLNGVGMAFRAKSPDRALGEMDRLSKRHGLAKFAMVDNILDWRYFGSFLPRLAAREDRYALFYEVVPMLRREQVETLAHAGVRLVQPGIESLSDEVLALLRKGNSAYQNLQLLKWCRTYGIGMGWNLLVGVLGERDEWYAEPTRWLPLLTHLPAPDYVGPVIYERFSPYFDEAEAFGLRLRPMADYAVAFPLAEAELFDLANAFEPDGQSYEAQMQDAMAARPHLRAFVDGVATWQALQRSHYPPQLVAHDRGDHLELKDTRPIAPEFSVRLEGATAELYRICDRATTAEAARRKLVEAGHTLSGDGVTRALGELVERRLVVEVGGRYLALALAPDLPRRLAWQDSPDGAIDLAGQIAARRGVRQDGQVIAADRLLQALTSTLGK